MRLYDGERVNVVLHCIYFSSYLKHLYLYLIHYKAKSFTEQQF